MPDYCKLAQKCQATKSYRGLTFPKQGSWSAASWQLPRRTFCRSQVAAGRVGGRQKMEKQKVGRDSLRDSVEGCQLWDIHFQSGWTQLSPYLIHLIQGSGSSPLRSPGEMGRELRQGWVSRARCLQFGKPTASLSRQDHTVEYMDYSPLQWVLLMCP